MLKHHEELQELVDALVAKDIDPLKVLEADAYIFSADEEPLAVIKDCLKAGAEAAKSSMAPHYLTIEGAAIFLYTTRAPNSIRSDLEDLNNEAK